MFNGGTIEYVDTIHRRVPGLTGGEGVPQFCGRTLDTALRPYDGLVTPFGVIDFNPFKNLVV